VLDAAGLSSGVVFNASVRLKVYERGAPGSGDRLLGFTPSRNKTGVRVPKHDDWFVRPMGSYKETDWKKFADAALKHRVPGLDLSQRWDVTDDTLSVIAASGELVFLRLDSTRVSDQGMLDVARLKNLQTLTVSPKTTDAGIPVLALLPKLRELDLRGSKVSEASWADLAQMKRLESLTLSRHFTDRGVDGLSALQNLRELDMSESSIGDAVTVTLIPLEKLEAAFFGPRITDQTLRQLSGHKKLRQLDVSLSRVTDAGVQDLGELPRLEQLALTDTAVSDAAMPSLAKLKNLRVLELSGTQVTTAGLEFLAALPKLEVVSLGWSKLSSGDVAALARCRSLRTIILDGTPLPENLMAQLSDIRKQPQAAAVKTSPALTTRTPRAAVASPIRKPVESEIPATLVSRTTPQKFSGLRRVREVETQQTEIQDVYVPAMVNPTSGNEMETHQSVGEINVQATRSKR